MSKKNAPEELSAAELEQLLYRRKRADTERRLQRLRAEGRVVGAPRGSDQPPYEDVDYSTYGRPPLWRKLANHTLLLVEIAAVVGLLFIIFNLWRTNQELNSELSALQRRQSQALVVPTAIATMEPLIDVAILPSGHPPPVEGKPPRPGEAGRIPDDLVPVVAAYTPPPTPTPSPEQARRIEIPAINVDHPIVQGDDWEQLKLGVGQHVGSGRPGEAGNMVLSAHNDIFGETFRYLDQLAAGDEIMVSSDQQEHRYAVSEVRIVEPTDVWVMQPTDHEQITLISCFPYRINTQRIVVFASPVEDS